MIRYPVIQVIINADHYESFVKKMRIAGLPVLPCELLDVSGQVYIPDVIFEHGNIRVLDTNRIKEIKDFLEQADVPIFCDLTEVLVPLPEDLQVAD